jgi:hypothetical protein
MARFRAEIDPSARYQIAQILLDHVQALEAIGRTGGWSFAANIGLYLISTLWEGARGLAKRLRLDPSLAPRSLGYARALNTAPGLASIVDGRRRIEQARAICRALVTQYGSAEEPDLRQIVARARVFEAAALVSLGRVRAGFRAFAALTNSAEEAAAEEFKGFGTAAKTRGGLHGDFGSVAFLFHRATTLGHGDSRIARIAYTESTRPGMRGSPSTRARAIVTRLLTPGKPGFRSRR